MAKGTVEDRVLAIQAKKEALIAQVRVAHRAGRRQSAVNSETDTFMSVGLLRTQECRAGQGENRCVVAPRAFFAPFLEDAHTSPIAEITDLASIFGLT